MSTIKNVCVYCGSSMGDDPAFQDAADALGASLAAERVTLVYGGGSLGLMGRIAHAVMNAGGDVVGIIPRFLHDREIMLKEVSELIVTQDMHERKRLMFDRSDAFVALPGGIGTLEEVVEMMTWSQLGQHEKPILLVNVKNFWAPLHRLLEHMVGTGFIPAGRDVLYEMVDDVAATLPTLRRQAEALAARRTPLTETLDRL